MTMDPKAQAEAKPQPNGIVYVREADRSLLPDELKDAPGKIFAVHDTDGNALAIAPNRAQAFALATRNNLVAVSVH